MIQMKSFMRPWAYGAWLLAAGLVLGWAGEAAAITLSVDKGTVREDSGETTITVKAKVDDDTAVDADTYVSLRLGTTDSNAAADPPTGDWKDWYDSYARLNGLFTITTPTIVIPKGKKEATETLLLNVKDNDDRGFFDTYDDFTIPKELKGGLNLKPGTGPGTRNHDNGRDNGRDHEGFHSKDPYPDFNIIIEGVAGNGKTVTPTNILVVDDERIASRLDLSFEPASLSKEAGPTPVKVTATLRGATLRSHQTFTLRFSNAVGLTDAVKTALSSDISGFSAATIEDTIAAVEDTILTRDSDYSATSGVLTLRKNRPSASTTITIDPKGKAGYIVLRGAAAAWDTLGIDLNRDGDRTDSLALFVGADDKVRLREAGLDCDVNDKTHDVNFDGDCTDVIREARAGIDLNGDGTIAPPGTDRPADAVYHLWEDAAAARTKLGRQSLKLYEGELKHKVTIFPTLFEIKPTPLADVKDDGLVATPDAIREEEGQREITLKVTLKAALLNDAGVSFTIEEIEGGGQRDVHYTVTVDELTIPAGETVGTTTLTLTSVNDSGVNEARSFKVKAEVGDGVTTAEEVITIVDDESLTSNIRLAVSPGELKAGTGATDVTVTGTLDGNVFDEDVTVTLVVTRDTDDNGEVEDEDKAAQRDTDYTARLRTLTIEAGEVSGSTTVSITPLAGGDKKVGLTALKSPVKNDDDEDVAVSTAVVTLKDADPAAETPDPGALAFDEDVSATVFEGTVGTAIDPIELPEATGGTGALTYVVSATLPAGLSFDATTRTISGTPSAAGTVKVTYTVIDSDPASVNSAAMIFTIEIGTAPPSTVAVASVASTHSSVRENGETTAITLTATLAAAAATAEDVLFTIVAPSAGDLAVRDSDYIATLGGVVTIAAGDLQGTTTLTLTPLNNAVVDGNKYLGVQASASGGSAQTDIEIADDETPSTSISLSVSPHTVSEAAGVTTLTVTATLDGKVLDAARTVTISVDDASAASRDVDYSALFNPLLVIPAGSTSGSVALLIDPTADSEDEGNETITLRGAIAGLTGGSAAITLSDSEAVAPEPEATSLAFADGASVADVMSTASTAIASVELPAAAGGTGDISYSVSDLPAGLAFDAATRTISGTPAEVSEQTEVTYTATDGAGATAALTFSITVNLPLSFGDSEAPEATSLAFADGASVADVMSTAGAAITSVELPAAAGGTGDISYSVSDLPAGLAFDATTRTISGTPAEVSEQTEVTYTATDGAGATAALTFSITVNLPLSFGDSEAVAPEPEPAPEATSLAFADGASVADVMSTAGTAITSVELPAAAGGTGDISYSVSDLPAGLAFDATTRTISGTPAEVSEQTVVEVTYTATDGAGATAALTFSITVNLPLSFGGFAGKVNAAGKVIPTASHDGAEIRAFVVGVGQRVEDLVLPAGTGGTAPHTYSLSPALPAGLSFDAATRTISGTPMAEAEPVYTYAVTDANGASATMQIQTLPAVFALANNYPNPFNPVTTINYALPEATDVKLTVYNVVGQPVRTLVAEHQNAGRYVVEWDATNDSGHSLSSGMYFYRLQAGGEFHAVKKMLLLK